MYILESSGLVNAGSGCNLTSEATAELEASFFEFKSGISNFGSIAKSEVSMSPVKIAYDQCKK